jgi:peroxiredoxin Q/BCP
MDLLKENTKAPDFSLLGSDGQEHSLKKYAGKKIVLYFYPKDDTPGCTQESCDFRDYRSVIEANNAVILGVSADAMDAHHKFASKYDLDFVLLSDDSKTMCRDFKVLDEKDRIQRTTYIINEQGQIAKVYAHVQVDGHVEDILSVLPLLK